MLEKVEDSGDVRASILIGEKAFCSGANLKERREMDADERRAHNRALPSFAERLARLKIPTIAAISGLALGEGFKISLACDLRIAAGCLFRVG